MAEEKIEDKTFADFIDSKEYNDHINGLKGTWGKAIIEKYETEKLPDIKKTYREEVIKEINPTETEEQARIRELEEKILLSEKNEAMNATKAALRSKAKEIGFDVSRADRYAAYGENAESIMIEDAEFIKTSVAMAIDSKTKDKTNVGDPSLGDKGDSTYDMKSRMSELTKKL